MERVLEECEKAGRDFEADAVHDLRVALRRCRSLADGMRLIDPDRVWKNMRHAAKPLFSALGELRDAQVLNESLDALGLKNDPVASALLEYASCEEVRLTNTAAEALQKFDRRQWDAWIDHLSQTTNRQQPGSLVLRHLALERWVDARQLHRAALRNRTRTSYHRLRIGIKRFRYTVENFLPGLHKGWEGDLKRLQDSLGEIHDLDVLWGTALRLEVFPDQATRNQWQAMIESARNKRIETYRQYMLGRTSLWNIWKAELPTTPEEGAAARLRAWATALDPHPQHARHVARLAVELYDGLCTNRLIRGSYKNGRETLRTAALMHEIGRSKTKRKHHKTSCGLIRKLKTPLGWSSDDLAMAALLVRHHRGRFPANRLAVRRLSREQRSFVIACASILRLADALDCERNEAVHKLTVHNHGPYVEIAALGYRNNGRLAEQIARARYPLETYLNRPVLVRANG